MTTLQANPRFKGSVKKSKSLLCMSESKKAECIASSKLTPYEMPSLRSQNQRWLSHGEPTVKGKKRRRKSERREGRTASENSEG